MKPSIMIVDDEPNAIASYRRVLHPYQGEWDVSYQTDSRVAWDSIHKSRPDVVVTDVAMPYMSGIELLVNLQSDATTQDIPVIVVTGEHDRGLKRRALDAGAADLMMKPIEVEELIARLRGSLRLKACHDELKHGKEVLEHRVQERTRELHRSRLEIVARLACAAESRDPDTGRHVVRVAHVSRLIAQALGLPSSDVDAIFVAAPLHDVGKIAIPDSILLKPGKLTEEETHIMRMHCEFGGRILGKEVDRSLGLGDDGPTDNTSGQETVRDPVLSTAYEIAVTHHERWDGSGYPAGLAGEEIPIAGRIVAIADVFDALTTARRYKPAYSIEHALQVISESVGRQFDPGVHAAFLSVISEIQTMYTTLADTSLK